MVQRVKLPATSTPTRPAKGMYTGLQRYWIQFCLSSSRRDKIQNYIAMKNATSVDTPKMTRSIVMKTD